ncbi:MAG TPA: copper amine oxidase N-terminal domain-containing protein [Alicyclobacillus sp.]|nr:copper amine oxidase N-terminal domain-containing protein [Alicyclobacillus sp.]
MNKGKKALAVLSTAVLFGTTPAAVALPFLTSTVAYAASDYITAANPPLVKGNQDNQRVATVAITLPQGTTVTSGDTFVVVFPDQVNLNNIDLASGGTYALGTTWGGSNINAGDNATVGKIDLGLKVIASTSNRIIFQANPTVNAAAQSSVTLIDDYVIYLPFQHVDIGGVSGPVNLRIDAATNSAFPSGDVTVANVNSSGSLYLVALDTQTSNNQFHFNLDLKEALQDSFRKGTYIKLKLPNGYVWNQWTDTNGKTWGFADGSNSVSLDTYKAYGSSTTAATVTVDGDTLTIKSNDDTSQPTLWEIPLAFQVDDESLVKPGDITVNVTGSATLNNTQLTVGTYGDYSATVTASDQPTIIAGHKEQSIGNITISEGIPGSLVSGRTVELTLPESARWEPQFEEGDSTKTPPGNGFNTNSNGLVLKFEGYTGTDKRTAKFSVDKQSSGTKGGSVTLENAQVAVEPGYEGDLTVDVGGSAGVSGSVTVAKVVSGFSGSISDVKDVIIGLSNQPIGDITISEKVAGAFGKYANSDNQVKLHLPGGVTWANTPSVKVTDGDLNITDVKVKDADIMFTVSGESTKPSTITITGAQLKVDRTVAEGPIALKVQGNSPAYTSSKVPGWNASDTALKFNVANVVTPAPNQQKTVATFTLGSTTYTVNGQQQTMDVAPYLKNDGRVMLPVRFVANALGVNDNSVIWNQSDKSVTIFKGGNVVKMTLGSNTLIVNGTAVQMDVAPELYNDGRVMLPIRWVGQALNADISWDQATQTVTVTAQ